jgi:ligand-binding sensor domain-containing protein
VRYDGEVWSTMDMRDRLSSNIINSVSQTADGALWFATEGVTRYQ